MRRQTIVVALLLCAVTESGAVAPNISQTNPIGTFVGTTPANAQLLEFIGAPRGTTAELIEWSLSLTSPSQYTLRAAYGRTMANFPGIARERKQADRHGNWTAVRGTKSNASADVIDLGGLAFVRVGPSILHALWADRSLMIGNGGWSFSLNQSDAAEPAVDPSLSAAGPDGSYTISPLATGPTVYGVFEGRTPCQGVARAMGRTVDPGCAKLKWRLTLYRDPENNRRPTTFKVEGSLFRSDRLEGPWTISDKGIIRLEGPNGTMLLSMLQVDDDVVMFLDRSGNLLVGNASFSYTLDRRKRP